MSSKMRLKRGKDGQARSTKKVTAPVRWQSAPDHPPTHLAYITDAERVLLANLDMHGSGVSMETPHYGPAGLPSLNGMGGPGTGSGGGGAAGTGGMGPGGRGGTDGFGGRDTGGGSSGRGSTGQGGSSGGRGGDGTGNSGSRGNTGGAASSAGGRGDGGGGRGDGGGGRAGGVGTAGVGGGFGGGNDRGGSARGGGNEGGFGGRSAGGITGGMGPGGAGGNVAGQAAAAAAAANASNTAGKADFGQSNASNSAAKGDFASSTHGMSSLPGRSPASVPGSLAAALQGPVSVDPVSELIASVAPSLSAHSQAHSFSPSMPSRAPTPSMGMTPASGYSGFGNIPGISAQAAQALGVPSGVQSLANSVGQLAAFSGLNNSLNSPLGAMSPLGNPQVSGSIAPDPASMSTPDLATAMGLAPQVSGTFGPRAGVVSNALAKSDMLGLPAAAAKTRSIAPADVSISPISNSSMAPSANFGNIAAQVNSVAKGNYAAPSSPTNFSLEGAALVDAVNAAKAALGFGQLTSANKSAARMSAPDAVPGLTRSPDFGINAANAAARASITNDDVINALNMQNAPRSVDAIAMGDLGALSASSSLNSQLGTQTGTMSVGGFRGPSGYASADALAAIRSPSSVNQDDYTGPSSVPGAYSNRVDTSGYTDFTTGAQRAISGDKIGAFKEAVDKFGFGTAMQMVGMFTSGSRAPFAGRSDMDRGGNDGGGSYGGGLLSDTPAVPAPPAPTYPRAPDWWQNWRQNYGQYGLLGPRPVATII